MNHRSYAIREIVPEDIPALFVVRIATRENALTLAELERLGITESSVRLMLRTSLAGWLCEVAGEVVGFSMANRATGEMWVIALLPAWEGHGIGARLLTAAEDYLWAHGWQEIWLTTDVDTSLRAYGFYRHQGWQDTGIHDGDRVIKKTRPASK